MLNATFVSTIKQYSSRYWWVIALGLLACGLAFAFPHLFHSTYPLDELNRDLEVVTRMRAGTYPRIGPPASVGGIYFGPAYYYVLYAGALIAGFSLHGLLLVGWVMWCITGLVLLAITWRWSGDPLVVCVTAGLYGFSILTFQLAQYVSNPNFVPLCALLFFYSLERCMQYPSGKRYKWVMLAALSFGIGSQLHAAACVGLLAAGLVSLKWLKATVLEFCLAAIICVLVYVPYVSYEFSHHFANVHGLVGVLTGPHLYVSFFDRILGYVQFWMSPLLSTHGFFNVVGLSGRYFIPVFAALLCMVPVLLRWGKSPRASYAAPQLPHHVRTVLGIWFCAPSVVYLLPIGALGGLQIYYYLVCMPLAFILGAYSVVLLWRQGRQPLAAYLLVVFLVLALYQHWLYRAVT